MPPTTLGHVAHGVLLEPEALHCQTYRTSTLGDSRCQISSQSITTDTKC